MTPIESSLPRRETGVPDEGPSRVCRECGEVHGDKFDPYRSTRGVDVPPRGNTICNPHPDAPHGFNRNASHNAGRYVCDCEGWMPPAGAKQAHPPSHQCMCADCVAYSKDEPCIRAVGDGAKHG